MWQAGLLCLIATAQAVVIHQAPVYASLDTNKLHPQAVYNTALNPQTTYNQPQTTYGYPQTIVTHPQTIYTQPQTTFTHPQTTFTHPQTTFTRPQTTYNYPQRPFGNQPQINHLQPSTSSNNEEDEDDDASYSYAYQIDDDLTGDHKSHSETRKGSVVQGSFTELRADGLFQITDYIADKDGYRTQIRLEKRTDAPTVPAKVPETVYQNVNPVVQNYIPRYTQPSKYQIGPVTFTPAKLLNNPVQPAPVTEQTKHTTVTVKPPAAYNPVVYASASTDEKVRTRTAPGSFTNPNQTPYKPVQ